MPNVGVLNLNPEQSGATALGAGLSKYLDMSADRALERKDSKALEDIYNKYRGDQDMIQKTFQALQTSPEISNHRKVQETKNLLDLERFNSDRLKDTVSRLEKSKLEEEKKAKIAKEDAEKAAKAKKETEDRQREIDANYEVLKDYEDEPEARRLAALLSPTQVNQKITRDTKPVKEPPKSQRQKVTENEEAKELHKLKAETIPKAQDALANLDFIDKQFDEGLTGLTGYAKGFTGFGGASEVDNIGFTAIEPIIKLFNPVGPIPVAKVTIIRNAFQPKATDDRWTFHAKTQALRRIAQQGLQRAQSRVAFLEQQDQPNDQQVKQFDAQSSAIEDQIVQAEIQKLSNSEQAKELPPTRPDGKVLARNKKTGQVGYVTPGPNFDSKYERAQQ